MRPEKLAPGQTLSRRDALVGGVTMFAGGLVASAPTSLALASIEPGTHSRFMRMSSLLINHRLNPDVGARIIETAVSQYTDLPGMLETIIAIAERKHAT